MGYMGSEMPLIVDPIRVGPQAPEAAGEIEIGADSVRQGQTGPDRGRSRLGTGGFHRVYLELRSCGVWSYLDLPGPGEGTDKVMDKLTVD